MALFIDGVDGTKIDILMLKIKAPNLDGIILDSIIDYLKKTP